MSKQKPDIKYRLPHIIMIFNRVIFLGDFFGLFIYCIWHHFIYRLSDSTVLEDVGMEPRTIVT